jgi:hypothetical protein
MNSFNSLSNFYSSLNDINIINNNLDEKREILKRLIEEFSNKIKTKSIDKKILSQNKEIYELLNSTINTIKKSSNNWTEIFYKIIDDEKFQNDFKNYFIVMIFGKVKAGKSSLGNFIAKNCTTNEKASFFVYDKNGQKRDLEKLEEMDDKITEFATNNLECTTEIQGFKLGGMAWIDTPGLGSMVKENGELAKKYIQNADYIIYPTSSSDPFTNDDVLQLKELFEQNKKVTICITKSDCLEDDECKCGSEDGCENCEEGIIKVRQNKSAERRLFQESYGKELFNKIKFNQQPILGDIFSISVYMAKQAIEKEDEYCLKNSNIPKFYELMQEVVEKKATKLKQEAPADKLKSFIENNILGINSTQENSIKIVKSAISQLEEKVKEIVSSFKILQENIESDLLNEIEIIITKYEKELDINNSKEKFKEIDDVLYKTVMDIIQKKISELFSQFVTSFNTLITSFDVKEFKIDEQFEKVKYSTKDRNKKIGAAAAGIIATVGIGFLTGGASLLVQGAISIVGGGAATYLGGKAGELTGSEEYESIRTGDNKEDVIQKFKVNRINHYKKIQKDIYKNIDKEFFSPLKKVIKEMNKDVQGLENNINNLLEGI